MSDVSDVTQGIPQGSILGHLLFTLYTTLFVSSITHGDYHLYADDTHQILYSFKKDKTALVLHQIKYTYILSTGSH